MKKVKKIVLKVARATLVIGSVLGFVFLFAAGVDKTANMPCSRLKINIDHETGNFFIDEDDLLPIINTYTGDTIIGKPVNEIDILAIEERVKNNPFVRHVNVFTNMKGELHVNVRQKRPIIRIINNSSVSYYLDENGEKMPLSHNFTSRVAVATGHIENYSDEGGDTSLLNGIYRIAKFIDSNDFWKAQVSQIHVTAKGEFVIVPRLGEHDILFGRAENIERKFEKLMIFYEEGLKNTGWGTYKTINVKYNGQIVAKKY